MLKTVPFKRTLLASMLTLASGAISAAYAAPATSPPATAPEQDKSKPNIVVIFGDDIGYWNLSTYNQGTMGYKTPNIDSIAAQGAKFTSYYAEQSSTAGRSSFITGQMPFRTGMSKVGMPGAPQGLQKEDPTIASILKQLGYATGQFGKNHLGDRDEFLPTAHGFDEFMGNLYHVICQSSLKMSNSDINHSGVRYNSSSYKMASVMVSAFEEALSKAIRNQAQCAHETPDSA